MSTVFRSLALLASMATVSSVGGSGTSDPQCKTGIGYHMPPLRGDACCPESCLGCGGPDCGKLSPGPWACCAKQIIAKNISCDHALPPCVVWTPNATASSSDPEAPATFDVVISTDIRPEPIKMTVNRSLAPLGADRFYALVNEGFYNNSAIYRVFLPHLIQFGISGSKDENSKWLHNPIKDDPRVASNLNCTVAFAATPSPNSRATEIFINFGDNSRLDKQGFAPFAIVTSGFDTAYEAFNPTPGNPSGVDQNDYETKGNSWIRTTFPGINFITGAAVVKTTETALVV